jgi:hypothetical protein
MLGYLLSMSGGLLALFGHLSPLAMLVIVTVGSGLCSAYISADCAQLTASNRCHRQFTLRQFKETANFYGTTSPMRSDKKEALMNERVNEMNRLFLGSDDRISPIASGKLSIQHTYTKSLRRRYRAFDDDPNVPSVAQHYVCPPISLETLRKRYGTRQSLWGEWNSVETRQFYKTQLPKALQIDGALGLSLEERAKLASQARYALRIYARERSHLPARILARVYDGCRHLHDFGSWASEGMTWPEVKRKYSREAIRQLGAQASQEEIDVFVYARIVNKSCSTNELFDEVARRGEARVLGSYLAQGLRDALPSQLLSHGLARLQELSRVLLLHLYPRRRGHCAPEEGDAAPLRDALIVAQHQLPAGSLASTALSKCEEALRRLQPHAMPMLLTNTSSMGIAAC